MKTKGSDRTRQDQGRPQAKASSSSGRDGEGLLHMDATQRIVEQLKRDGGEIETHADGTGLLTIGLRWPRTDREPVFGRGRSFPAALSELVRAVEQ